MTGASCASCGEPYQKRRRDHLYCCARCRVRGNRAASVPATPAEPGLVDAVKRDLEAAGVLDTPGGLQAVALATRMVHGSAKDTGSAFAAVSRELSRALEDAKRKPGAQVNPVDEFTKRRQAKRGAA